MAAVVNGDAADEPMVDAVVEQHEQSVVQDVEGAVQPGEPINGAPEDAQGDQEVEQTESSAEVVTHDIEHNDDEYDPANPAHDPDEYDPANPSYAPVEDAPEDMEQPQSETTESADEDRDVAPMPNTVDEEQESVQIQEEQALIGKQPLQQQVHEQHVNAERSKSESIALEAPSAQSVKRKPSDSTASVASASVAPKSPKRPRHQTHTNSGATVTVDKRGLHDSAWDRLMDFETSGEFRVAQVSRAAFSSIALLPEFAQCTIVARFARTPMKEIRDKNGLIMRLYHEYLGENPHISSLQPASTYIDDITADPALFEFGYAPPMPVSGVSKVKIPYRFGDSSITPLSSVKSKAAKPAAQSNVDEFGRILTTEPRKEAVATAELPLATRPSDPRRTSTTSDKSSVTSNTPAVVASTNSGKPSDPRRRRSDPPATTTAADTVPGTRPTDPRKPRIEKSDVYNRLPRSVKTMLDILINEDRLPEAINDNVLSRLNHLPEATALLAMEKFTTADLAHVDNINGFLVGIINRIQQQDRGAAAEMRGAQSTGPNSRHYAPNNQPTQPLPLTGAPLLDHHPAAHSLGRHPGDLAGSSQFRDHHPQQAPAGQPPMGYDRRGPPPQQSEYMQQTPAPGLGHHGPLMHGGASQLPGGMMGPGAGAPGRFSHQPTIDQAVAALPVSVQNHLLSLVNSRILPSLEEFSEKCYEVLAQLSEGLANEVLKRFATANLTTVRNRSGFLIGVVKKCRQEYGFN